MDTSISRLTQPCQGLVLLMAVALAALHSPLALPQLKPAVLKQDWPEPGTVASPSSYQLQSMRFILGLQSVSCFSVPDTA